MEEYTIERFMDKIVFSDTEKIKKDYPYHAFPIIAIGIEIIGRLACDEEFDKSGVSGELFYKAIQTCPSLGAYKKYNADKNINLLYKGLRCSMLHSFIPDGFRLAPGKNDFSKDEIGCEELYNDVRKAWEYIRNRKRESIKKVLFTVDGVSSGSTINNIFINEANKK